MRTNRREVKSKLNSRMIRLETLGKVLLLALLIIWGGMDKAPIASTTRAAGEKSRNEPYVSPAQLSPMPAAFRQQLLAEGCTIPQTVYGLSKNVIRGHFATTEQVDWAVLCSRNGKSRIRVFWGGPTRCAASLAAESDGNFLFENQRGEREFWRAITAMAATAVLSHYRAYSLTSYPTPDHDAIDDAFVEKGSIIWYCQAGKWIRIPGSD